MQTIITAAEISLLHTEVLALRTENVQLKKLLQEALDKLNKNSSNSSKPPSSDIVRTKSLRIATGKKVGGQAGHKGHHLPMSNHIDDRVIYKAKTCTGCGKDISGVGSQRFERRQVYDIPVIQIKVTEHQSEIKCCPHCACENRGTFPLELTQPTQYGSNIKQLGVYLSQYQLLPFQRSVQMIEDLTGHRISQSSLGNFTNNCSQQLSGFMEALKQNLLQAPLVHADETGYYYENNRNWLHVATTEDCTYYYPHEKRGKEAMDAMGILPTYTGALMHDYWKSYLDYDCQHYLCNVHHLRDLTFCQEQEKSTWAMLMKTLLLDMKQGVDDAIALDLPNLTEAQQNKYLQRYDSLIAQGNIEHPLPQKEAGKRGAVKKSKSKNLLDRFAKHKDDITQFIKNFAVPFGNNIAEQAVRMMKLKQKISGCFRSKEGAVIFATIRSYIDTMRKNGYGIMDALALAINGKPIIPFMPAYSQ